MTSDRIPGFRLGIYVFKDAEIVDFAAPYGVFSVARRFDPELEACAAPATTSTSSPRWPGSWSTSEAYALYREDVET